MNSPVFRHIAVRAAILCCLMTLSAVSLSAQSLLWRSYTSHSTVNDLLWLTGGLWAATGGGVFRHDPGTGDFVQFNNTAGLSAINPSALAVDGDGTIWVALGDGTLNTIDPDDYRVRTVTIDPAELAVNDIVYYDNSLYLALDFGVSLFLIGKKEINSTYRTLGSFPMNSAVTSLYVLDGRIWAAAQHGIASAPLDAPNLQDPQFWDNFTAAEGLGGTSVFCFAGLGDTLLAGTDAGVFRYDGNGFVSDGLSGERIRAMTTHDGALIAAGWSTIYARTGRGAWTPRMGTLSDITALASVEGAIWAGHSRNGLYLYEPGAGTWENIQPDGPASNTFEAMTVDGDGRLWAATGQSAGRGIVMYNGAAWRQFGTADGLSSNYATGIAAGPDGRIWAGTPGQGLNIFDLQPDSLRVTKIDTADGRLAGSNTPAFVVVPDVLRDAEGNMWIVNKFANNGNVLAVVTPENQWFYFSVSDGIPSNRAVALAADEFNRIWIGTDNRGVALLDHGGTPGEKSDDRWVLFDTNNDLSSNRVTGIAAEEGNGVWVATEDGVNHIIEGITVQEIPGALSNMISSVAVDPAHNKWFGTPNGVSVLQYDDFTWTHYTTMNSMIVHDDILRIFFHSATGTVYIATSAGLSVAETPFKSAPESGVSVSVYPNPYVLDSSGRDLVIEGFSLRSTVKIFTISGRLVRDLSPDNGGVFGSQAFWDGTDVNGDPVPSGVYLVAAGTEKADVGVTKLAVIRK